MCGIAGYVERHEGARRPVVDAQLRTLLHRGPDAIGAFVQGRGTVGQTRLSVIDLDTGDPPITDESGRIGVALNGEIYNFAALRNDLTRRGHTLTTKGDTEVIAHLAEELSPVDIARRLHGMFAFAVWDDRRGVLTLGRDRLGKKPLYYWAGPGSFVFGSEIKAVLAHPLVTPRFDEAALPDYLMFGYVPTPRTFFDGIRSVPPGHVLTVDPDLGVSLECYWAPVVPRHGRGELDVTPSEAAAEVRRVLDRAVERRLVADVPLGAFLSGGVDSSAIVASMSACMSTPVKTFTIGFDDDSFDERDPAAVVARRFGTDHTEFVVEPHAVELVERLVWHYDQPFGDSSAIPTFLLSELTAGRVTVALSGDGGDECFAGYERFVAGLALGRLARVPRSVFAGAARLLGAAPADQRFLRRLGRFAGRAGLGLPDAYRSWIDYVPAEQRAALLPGRPEGAGAADYRELWGSTAGATTLARLLELNIRTYLLDDLLPKVDRMSMAHGLEVRSPFLDHEVVELAMVLPSRTKVRGLSLKRVLKDAYRDVLPAEILDRRKQGFGVPLGRWFRGSLGDYIETALGPKAQVARWLDSDALRSIVAEHRAGRADHGYTLWTVLTLEVFLRERAW